MWFVGENMQMMLIIKVSASSWLLIVSAWNEECVLLLPATIYLTFRFDKWLMDAFIKNVVKDSFVSLAKSISVIQTSWYLSSRRFQPIIDIFLFPYCLLTLSSILVPFNETSRYVHSGSYRQFLVPLDGLKKLNLNWVLNSILPHIYF